MNAENNIENDDSGSTSNVFYRVNSTRAPDNDLDEHIERPFTFGCQAKCIPDSVISDVQANRFTYSKTIRNYALKSDENENTNCLQFKRDVEPFFHGKLDSLMKLKDSTRKLLCLLEEIQSKTHSKHLHKNDYQVTDLIKPIPNSYSFRSVSDIIGRKAIIQLENQAKNLEAIYVEDEEDDCSIYKRLTRKCHCLNQDEYNDFIIHFNEDTKYFTSNIGEIIKNMRILKKFLYMGGDYEKHALMFLNEGLGESSHTEKVEITHGCSHADICNVFEDHSIVLICISWPCKYENYGDAITQALTASFLFKLAHVEEGRRYLRFSSKITNDLKKVIRKRASKLEFNTLETMNAILNLINPPTEQLYDVSYYCKPVDEDVGNKTLNALVHYRQYMTQEEVFTHLDFLHHLSNSGNGKRELTEFLPALLGLFKRLLMEFDNSKINITVTNILNNLVSRNMVNGPELPKTLVMADTATEPIHMKNEMIQIPPKNKKGNKSKLSSLGLSPNKLRHPYKKGTEWVPSSNLNRSGKFAKGTRSHVIVVPIEE